ncbi:MAG: DUF2934 domain-containing protein [Trueperaceae bacterium]|nr:DUF2934 domain-containing protein [Trueperaceae bacterium]
MADTGTKSTRKPRQAATPEIPADAIERRAYEKFAARGFAHGADFDDWRQAEEELASELAPAPKRAAKAAAKGSDAGAVKPAPKKRAAKAANAPAAKRAAPRKTQKA